MDSRSDDQVTVTRYLLDPSVLLTLGVEGFDDLVRVLEHKAGEDSCVSIVSGIIQTTPTLFKIKKTALDTKTALREYLGEFTERSTLVQEALEEPDLETEDTIGGLIYEKLATVWRLKAIGLPKLLDKCQDEMTAQIGHYVDLILQHASTHSVGDTYCRKSSEDLEEACKTFTSSTQLLFMREKVDNEMDAARSNGVKAQFLKVLTEFLIGKSETALEALLKQAKSSLGTKLDATTLVKLETALFIITEDATKNFPNPSQYGENVKVALDLFCKGFLTEHVMNCLVLNMSTSAAHRKCM